MKKLFSICLMLLTFAAFSQNMPTVSTFKTMKSGTLTNSGTTYIGMPSTIAYFYEVCSFQIVCTKVSGTLNGYCSLQYSNDNTNWVEVDITDSLHISNQTTNTKTFVITNNKGNYYRIACVGRTTQSISLIGYFTGSGQRMNKIAKTMLSSYSLESDTITNTGSGYVQFNIDNKYFEKISFQPVVTRLSGTAGGTVTLQGSNDGTNYTTVSSSYASATTMSVSNTTTNTAIITVTSSPYKYYRLSYTGTGTMSCTLKGYISASN